MLKKRLMGLMTLALCAGLTLTACGDDPAQGNNGANNGANNGGTDAGPDADATGGDAGDAGEKGCISNIQCAADEVCDQTTGECVFSPTGCDLPEGERPERCGKTVEETEFGSFSLVNQFEIAGREVGDDVDPECCFDYTGDDEIDNALGETLLSLDAETFHSLNQSIAENIADGSLLLMFEHAGLTDLSAEEEYTLNFWLGERNDAGDLFIDPASVDDGTQPQAFVESATIDSEGKLSAGPGTIRLTIDLLDTPLTLLISMAQIEAQVDLESSSIADGIVIATDEDDNPLGKLGGVVRLTDLFDGINTFTSTCECLALEGDPLIDYSFDSEYGLVAECNAGSSEAQVCKDAGESSCQAIAENCGLISNVLPSFADVDIDSDSYNDAISIGAKFTTEGVTVEGIGAE